MLWAHNVIEQGRMVERTIMRVNPALLLFEPTLGGHVLVGVKPGTMAFLSLFLRNI